MPRIASLVNTFEFLLLRHPITSRSRLRTTMRWIRWQIGSRLLPGAAVVPFVGASRLVLRPGMHGATGNLYAGLHEFDDMSFVLHALRPGDLFVDVGANDGTYTILASRVRGAHSIAIEPVPATFVDLQTNVAINAVSDLVELHQAGVGRAKGVLSFTTHLGPMNHIATDAELMRSDLLKVSVETLDSIVGDRSPTVLKVDVEGAEADVVAGASRVLESESLLAVIMETAGYASRYGHDQGALDQVMRDRGFQLCTYAPFQRELRPVIGNGRANNTIYVRNAEQLSRRLKSAEPVDVLGVAV